jgi:hypothetical protein
MARYQVHLVVDREFRAADWQLPADEPVWIVDTVANQPSVSTMCRCRKGQDHLTGITTFRDSPDCSPEELAATLLPVIDLHHGEYSSVPPYDALHVIGARKSVELLAAAAAFGLIEVHGKELDFEMQRPHDAAEDCVSY